MIDIHNLKLNQEIITGIREFPLCDISNGCGICQIQINSKIIYKGKQLNPILKKEWLKIYFPKENKTGIINPAALLGVE